MVAAGLAVLMTGSAYKQTKQFTVVNLERKSCKFFFETLASGQVCSCLSKDLIQCIHTSQHLPYGTHETAHLRGNETSFHSSEINIKFDDNQMDHIIDFDQQSQK